MAVHLVKLAVGIDSIPHLQERQRQRVTDRRAAGEPPTLRILTRNTPRRGEEILAGEGSLYWVIRGRIQVRQRITGFEDAAAGDGTPRCAILLAPELVRVRSRRSRPFQGWRYLEGGDAPADVPGGLLEDDEPPPEMAEALRELGLI